MRFDVNPTDNVMAINLGNNLYKDVTGKSYSGIYQLEPYGSRILQFISVIFPISAANETVSIDKQDKFFVYPTPNAKGKALKLSINNPISELLTLKVISINGDLFYNQKVTVNEGNTVIDLPSLPKGIYLLESTAANGKCTVIKFIQ